METKQILNAIKQLAREMANEKYQVERNDKAKAIIDFAEIIETQANDANASEATAILPLVSKRYFLFGCVNTDKQKLNKLIIAEDKESAIADLKTSFPYIERWYTIEELNVC